MTQQLNIPGMLNQSKDVLTSPNVGTFERYERSGTLTSAAIYVAIAALIAGILGIFYGGILGIIAGILRALAQFFIFSGLVYYIGKSQRGTGTFDEVAYTFSLFIAPLIVIGGVLSLFSVIPVLGPIVALLGALALLVAQVYYAYIAVKSSMNIRETGPAAITLGGAFLGTLIILFIINLILLPVS